ncbi:MAG: TonB-dependent receptor [Pseudorhodoferax sp.]
MHRERTGPSRHPWYGRAAALAAAIGAVGTAMADTLDLADLSLEQLGEIRISSVSRRTERLQDAAASVYVITADQIRRSGARTLPDALRLAPNLHVAQSSSNDYVISARGLNSAGNKMLVLLDGRILYTPLYSGVLWDAQEAMLEDVERIEVVSGPGGTLWGSNAVNGVINIITRAAGETQGVAATLGAGGGEKLATARYGSTLGADGHYRLYAKGIERPANPLADGRSTEDRWHRQQAGFRADWNASGSGLTLQGDAYQGRSDQPLAQPDSTFSGHNLLARWNRTLSEGEQLQLQAYLDQTVRVVPSSQGDLSLRLRTIDVSFQHNLQPLENHQLIWGAGHRRARDRIDNVLSLAFLPSDVTLKWSNLFVQDEIALRPDLKFSAGAKAEHNPYTGWEFMPSARLAWQTGENQLLWGALSRAVRTPARLDRDLYAPAQAQAAPLPPYLIAGGPDFRSETSHVVELGWRAQPTPTWSYALTAFHHRYRHLRSVEAVSDPAYAIGYYVVDNKMRGHANGLEGWSTWQLTPRWSLGAGAAYLRQHLRLDAGSTDATGTSAAGNDPRYQWMLRSSLDLPAGLQLQLSARRVGALPAPRVPGYTAVDGHLAWQVLPQVSVALTVSNLLDRRHVEYGTLPGAAEIRRQAFLSVSWKL